MRLRRLTRDGAWQIATRRRKSNVDEPLCVHDLSGSRSLVYSRQQVRTKSFTRLSAHVPYPRCRRCGCCKTLGFSRAIVPLTCLDGIGLRWADPNKLEAVKLRRSCCPHLSKGAC